MDIHQIETRIQKLLEKILEISPNMITPTAHIMADLGADSWQYLEFRNELERIFQIMIPDADVDRLSTIQSCTALIAEYLKAAVSDQGQAEKGPTVHTPQAPGLGVMVLGNDDALYMDLEVGIPLLGRNNLGETPLMKLLGELRWNHIREFTKVPSKKLVDDAGDRLYATFYYVEMQFPRERPMASLGENDRLTVVNTLSSYGNSIMDGYTFFYPANWPAERKVPLLNGRQAVELGIPYIRSSNIFVKMLKGASWLKKSRPCQPGVDNIPKIAEVPDTYASLKKASEEGRFRLPPDNCSPVTDGRIKVEYQIEPDQDLNGVGLLYFANYVMILDISERRVLPDKALIPLSDDLVDLRTVVYRQSAYLSNAHQSDSIEVSIEAWMENPFLAKHPAPEMSPVRLFLNYEMVRRSDGRKMLVSTAEKVIFGKTMEETGLLEKLEALARAAASPKG